MPMDAETVNEVADFLKQVVYVRATDLADAIHALELFAEAHEDMLTRERLMGEQAKVMLFSASIRKLKIEPGREIPRPSDMFCAECGRILHFGVFHRAGANSTLPLCELCALKKTE